MNKNNSGCEKLWAPWRMKYIESVDVGDEGCIFCQKPAQNDDDRNLILKRGEHCFIIMNLFPYNNGHLMVVPYKHTSDMNELDADTRLEMMDLVNMVINAMSGFMRPDGFNVGMNLGRCAGAGIADHLHMHIVPRWNGDTNFMPIIGCSKVISESLEDTFVKLQCAIREQENCTEE